MPRRPRNMTEIRAADLKRWMKSPPDRQVYEHDALVRGLQLRRGIDGTMTWCVRSRRLPGGRRPWYTLGHYPAVGVAEARELARKALAGVFDGPVRRRREVTWQQCIDAYCEAAHAKGNRSVDYAVYMIGRLPKSWLDGPAHYVDYAAIRRFVMEVGNGGSPVAANRFWSLIAAVFAAAREAGLNVEHPLAGRRRPFAENRTIRVLDFAEIRAWWEATLAIDDAEGGVALRLLLLTAARSSEVRTARWDDIRDAWLVRETTKAKREHRIFLSPQAQAEIARLERVSPWLFPATDPAEPCDTFIRAVRQVRRISSVEWSPHVLRKTALSHMVQHCGVEPGTTAKVVANHRLPGVTAEHYLAKAALYPAAVEAWIAWGRLVESIVSGEAGQVVEMRSHG